MSLVHSAYRLAHAARVTWWRIRRPTNHGVMVALWCGSTILLVRTSYRPGWTLPGGFVDRGEELPKAAARELREELQVSIEPDRLREVAVIYHATESLRDHVHVFECEVETPLPLTIDNREVVEAAFVEAGEALRLDLFPPVRDYFARRRETPDAPRPAGGIRRSEDGGE